MSGANRGAGGNAKLQQTQQQVDEVVGIMKNNVDKVLERDAKLTDLEDKTEALRDGAARFETTSKKLKHKMWWKNCKMWGILFAVVALLILIIVLWTKPWN
eukprot:Colp12_sorted_trinity150504_noHs@7311